MARHNSVTLLGNLATEPRRVEYDGGSVKTSFKLAVDQIDREKPAHYFWIKCWGAQAESVAANLTKGSEVLVDGELNSYDRKNDDGTWDSSIDINARSVTFLRRPNGNGATPAAVEAPLPEASDEAPVAVPADDDIPF